MALFAVAVTFNNAHVPFAAPRNARKAKTRLERAMLTIVAAREGAVETLATHSAGLKSASYRVAEAPLSQVEWEVLTGAIIISW